MIICSHIGDWWGSASLTNDAKTFHYVSLIKNGCLLNVDSHHDGIDYGFSACVSYASGIWGSYGPYMTRIGHWLNPSIIFCWNRGPRDPRGVPWDQNFWSKFFLTSTSNELILWVLWIGFAKNAKNQEKLLIFGHFQLYPLLLRKCAKISSFLCFSAFLA